jgi:hypothetical protein
MLTLRSRPTDNPTMAVPTCAFPLFRERFLQPLQEGNAPPAGLAALAACPGSQGGCPDPQLSPTKAASRMGNLRVLDLRALPRDDGPPTELRARKEKLAHFERQCSRVAEGLYVGAEHVAKSRESLRQAGITHVVNCVGFLYPPYFEDELQYKVLYLQGEAQQGCGGGLAQSAGASVLQRVGDGVAARVWRALAAAGCRPQLPVTCRHFSRSCDASCSSCCCRHAWGGHAVHPVRRV